MNREPLHFVRPHRRNCPCPSCKAARAPSHPWTNEAERRVCAAPPAPRTPEDGHTVHTPEQGHGPMTRD